MCKLSVGCFRTTVIESRCKDNKKFSSLLLLFSWLKETFSASFVLYGASELENRCEHSVILHFLPLLWGVKAPFAALYYSRVTPLVYLMESPRGGICHDLPSSVIVCGVQFPVSCRQFHGPTVTSPVPSCAPPVAHLQLPLLLFVPFRSRNGWPSSNGVPFAAVFLLLRLLCLG